MVGWDLFCRGRRSTTTTARRVIIRIVRGAPATVAVHTWLEMAIHIVHTSPSFATAIVLTIAVVIVMVVMAAVMAAAVAAAMVASARIDGSLA